MALNAKIEIPTKSKKATQTLLAKTLGVTQPTVSKYNPIKLELMLKGLQSLIDKRQKMEDKELYDFISSEVDKVALECEKDKIATLDLTNMRIGTTINQAILFAFQDKKVCYIMQLDDNFEPIRIIREGSKKYITELMYRLMSVNNVSS